MRVMICGGGTGGHIMPALALTEYITLHHPHSALWYIGRRSSMEERLVTSEGLRFGSIHAAPFKKGFGLLKCVFLNLLGVIESCFLILRHRPLDIIGFGGYASFPLMLAGLLLRRNVVIHEANALPGKAVTTLVKLGAKFAYGIDTGLPALKALCDRAASKRGACMTGNPVRRSLLESVDLARENFTGLQTDTPTLLVIGGSQGARFLNRIICAACGKLHDGIPRLQIIHITGAIDVDLVNNTYEMCDIPHYVTPFCDKMNVLYALASCVIARAGAMTISEICISAVPALLVPFPYAAEKHQHENAAFLANAGGAIVIDQSDVSSELLVSQLTSLMNDSGRVDRMAENNKRMAAPNAAAQLWEFARGCQA